MTEVHIPHKGWRREKPARDLLPGDIVIFVSDRPPLYVVDVLHWTETEVTFQVSPIRSGYVSNELGKITFPKERRVAYSVEARGN